MAFCAAGELAIQLPPLEGVNVFSVSRRPRQGTPFGGCVTGRVRERGGGEGKPDGLRFEVNLDATQQARLKLSSHVLALARRIVCNSSNAKS
ncbi:MAG: hypothetical protein DMG33_12605 [Acidobacteria bacterium]|nr:MAG: hypothetical protein DMG33_12605 [Acidobacteriota bacterium]